jgi:uncharacterized protein (TIGR02996 family)
MSPEELRLLEDVCAAPDDDGPRLIYADWLADRGDPRAELIQLQCRLAAEPDDARRRAMRIAENKLLKAHEAAWLAPLFAVLPPPPLIAYVFEHHRGFVTSAKLALPCLPMLGEVLERAPLLHELVLMPDHGSRGKTTMERPELGDALDDSLFERFTRLELSLPGGGNAVARAVAASPALRNVTTLTIGASIFGEAAMFFVGEDLVLDDEGVLELARAPHLRGVRHLNLASNRITLAGVHAIANGAWRLESLDLGQNAIEPEGLAAALASPATAGLHALALCHTPIAADEAARLAASSALAALRDLDLESCALGAAGTAAFCESLALPALRRLRIERNSLGDAGAKAIAGCAALAQLTSLEAGHNRIGQKGGAAIASSPHLTNLERLTLNEPKWKPEMAALFASSPTLARTKIYLRGKLLARAKPVT